MLQRTIEPAPGLLPKPILDKVLKDVPWNAMSLKIAGSEHCEASGKRPRSSLKPFRHGEYYKTYTDLSK